MPGRVVAQWDKDDCEDLGIVKVDLLGLGMMSVMQDAFELCRERGRPLDLAHIPKDDAATFEMMQKADTIGVFQIESRAQMATLAADEAEMFLRCRHRSRDHPAGTDPGRHGASVSGAARRTRERSPISIEPALKPILKRTLGVPLFQEQMLKIAMVMADFSGDEAEELRRALSFHRSQERMEKVSVKLRAAMDTKECRAGGDRENHAIDHLVRALRISGIARDQFCDSRLWERVSESASRAGVLRQPAEQSADGLLRAGDDCEGCAPAWTEDGTGLRARNPIGVARWFPTTRCDLGFCVVNGLRQEHAEELVQATRRRCRFDRWMISSGAWRCRKKNCARWRNWARSIALAEHRRAAMWQVEEREPDLLLVMPSERCGVRANSCRSRGPTHAQADSERIAASSHDDAGAGAGRLRNDEPDDRSASDETFARQICRISGERAIWRRRDTARSCRSPAM